MVFTTAINQEAMRILVDEFPEQLLAYCNSAVPNDTMQECTSREAVA